MRQHYWDDDTDRSARNTRIARMRVYRDLHKNLPEEMTETQALLVSVYWAGVLDALAEMREVDRAEVERLRESPTADITYEDVPLDVRERRAVLDVLFRSAGK